MTDLTRECGCDTDANHVEPHVDPVLGIEHGERAYDDPQPHEVPSTRAWHGNTQHPMSWQSSPDMYCLCGHPNYLTCGADDGRVIDLVITRALLKPEEKP